MNIKKRRKGNHFIIQSMMFMKSSNLEPHLNRTEQVVTLESKISPSPMHLFNLIQKLLTKGSRSVLKKPLIQYSRETKEDLRELNPELSIKGNELSMLFLIFSNNKIIIALLFTLSNKIIYNLASIIALKK